MTGFEEINDADQGGGKARGRADAQRPARAEPIRHPPDQGRAEGRAAQGDGEENSHHAPAHGGLGGELHRADRRGGERLSGRRRR